MHYKVGLSDGKTMQFDSDRQLSQEEVQGVVNQHYQSQQPSMMDKLKSGGQKVARFGLQEGLPLAGMVGGEALGAMGGAALAPATEGTSLPVGDVAGGGIGYGAGKMASDQLQEMMGMKPKTPFMSKAKDFPKQAAIGAGYTIGGKLIGPAIEKGFPRLAGALTGVDAKEFAKHAKDLKATLPEWMGGAKTVEKAQVAFRDAFKKAGVNPAKAEFDAFATSGTKRQFIKEVERSLKYPAKGGRIATHDLIKAYDSMSDEIGKAFSAGENKAARQLIERKGVIRKALFDRSDDIAKAYKTLSRAKMADNVSSLFPGGKDYLIRRALMPVAAYGNPKFLIGMSPRILSGAQMAGGLAPASAAIGGVVDMLRRRRNEYPTPQQ